MDLHEKTMKSLGIVLVILSIFFGSLLLWKFYVTGDYWNGTAGIVLFYIDAVIIFNPTALKIPGLKIADINK